jgi:hypothetical protein
VSNKVLVFIENAEHKFEATVGEVSTAAADAAKVLVDVQKADPAIKTGILQLVSDAEAVATATVAAGGADGVNFASDAAAVAAVQTLVKNLLAFLPTLKSAAAAIVASV